eukprot:1161263-Pelagomonas_calceolata.AAC.24
MDKVAEVHLQARACMPKKLIQKYLRTIHRELADTVCVTHASTRACALICMKQLKSVEGKTHVCKSFNASIQKSGQSPFNAECFRMHYQAKSRAIAMSLSLGHACCSFCALLSTQAWPCSTWQRAKPSPCCCQHLVLADNFMPWPTQACLCSSWPRVEPSSSYCPTARACCRFLSFCLHKHDHAGPGTEQSHHPVTVGRLTLVAGSSLSVYTD